MKAVEQCQFTIVKTRMFLSEEENKRLFIAKKEDCSQTVRQGSGAKRGIWRIKMSEQVGPGGKARTRRSDM